MACNVFEFSYLWLERDETIMNFYADYFLLYISFPLMRKST